MRAACDVGGTFTDLVIATPEGLRAFKAPTTPADPVLGLLDAFDVAAAALRLDRRSLLASLDGFVHATTRATNAILTSRTARTALLVTEGHRDILLLREGGRTDPYDNTRPYPPPLVPRALTFEVPERIGADGAVVTTLDEGAVAALAERLIEAEVEAVAVCLLWSVANPAHELAVGRILAATLPGVPVTLSHALNPIVREYRRAASACLDAALKPLMSDYLRSLEARLGAEGFAGRLHIVTSQGGVMDVAAAIAAPIHTIGSGPAMAPVAGRRIAAIDAGAASAIVADTGGTSYDVSLVRDGVIPWTMETWLGPRFASPMTGFPSVDVRSVGAGGGSIARVDAGGMLTVGPDSAGADPGPACYGRGGSEPTVTDAALALGWLDPDCFLGGRYRLDREAARHAIARHVAAPLQLELEEAAAAIVAVATQTMVGAIEAITVQQGIDPRAAVLVAGGGAAGLNSVAIARALGCAKVLFPDLGAALSAAGALVSDLRQTSSAVLFTRSDSFDDAGVASVVQRLAEAATVFIAGVERHGEPRVAWSVEARYPQQTWEIELAFDGAPDRPPTPAALAASFHAAHLRLYGVADPGSAVEFLTWRVRVDCPVSAGDLATAPATPRPDGERRGTRRAWFAGRGWVDADVRWLAELGPGDRVVGPALIDSEVTTIVVEPGVSAIRAASGSIVVEPSRAAEPALPGRAAREPARLAIVANRLESIARKMAHVLHRTGRSGLINTARDLSACILTADHELVCEAESLPSHVLVGPDIMSRWLKTFHPEPRRGDAFLHNSPYHGNSHAADHTIMVPVIDDDGVHRLTTFVKAHQADIGNSRPTSYHGVSRDVYEEGALIFPAVQVQRDYRDIEDIVRMCRMRIRVAEQWWGDYQALVGAARTGEQELLALGRELGWDTLQAHLAEWFDYAEQRMATALRRLPAGSRTRGGRHDPFPGTAADGVPIKVTVRSDPDAGRIEIDLTRNPDTLPNGLNITEANAGSAAMIGLFSSLGETVPRNAGSYRRVAIRLRAGSCIGGSVHPACCSLSTTNLASRIGNATQAAMAELAGGFGLAEAGVIVPASMAVISGRDPRHGGAFMNSLFLMHTGGPAAPRQDGWLTTVHIGDLGLCYLDSIELDELRYPIRVVRRGILPDSEGAGQFRGAPCGICEYGPVGTAIEAWYASDGAVNPPAGVLGGGACGPSSHHRRRTDGTLVELPPCGGVLLEPGETIVSVCCGGGGYGDPRQRDPAWVRRDLAEGWISAERAAAVYGLRS